MFKIFNILLIAQFIWLNFADDAEDNQIGKNPVLLLRNNIFILEIRIKNHGKTYMCML